MSFAEGKPPPIALQWYRGRAGEPFERIPGATALTYMPTADDVNFQVGVACLPCTGQQPLGVSHFQVCECAPETALPKPTNPNLLLPPVPIMFSAPRSLPYVLSTLLHPHATLLLQTSASPAIYLRSSGGKIRILHCALELDVKGCR